MRPRLVRRIRFTALVAPLFAGSLLAQLDQGQISGFVKDPSNASVVGAAVKIRNEASGFVFQSKTNERGLNQAPNLVPGLYTLEVESPGFKKFSESHVKLDAASTATVNVDLNTMPVLNAIPKNGGEFFRSTNGTWGTPPPQNPPYTGIASSPLLPASRTYYSYMHLRATGSDNTSQLDASSASDAK